MSDISTNSLNKIPIELTVERQSHISARHPEFKDQWTLILEVISNPDELYTLMDSGDEYAALKLTNYLTDYTVVYYKEVSNERGFVITAHPVSKKRKKKLVQKWLKVYPK